MVQLTLPKNSKVKKGKHHPAPSGAKTVKTFKVYRWDPEKSAIVRAHDWMPYDVK